MLTNQNDSHEFTSFKDKLLQNAAKQLYRNHT